MAVIYILMTDPQVERYDNFDNGETTYVFDRLASGGPRRLLEGPVCVFVDWVLEDLSGLEMCRRLRADSRTGDAHITMVLESCDAENKRRALAAGADDYVLGPIDRTSVLDRVLALGSGRVAQASTRPFRLGDLEIDMPALQARWKDQPIPLRPNEFRLLRFFAENADRVLGRSELIDGLGKQDPPIDERTVDVWIGRLRRALRQVGVGDPIRTVRSLGYVYDSH
ncbi:response regulator transcription factor [Erythrobacter sp. SD-21]|uniref:response regulator transcription factor n=1 Tax=Erythrobacter sp. SD-21 TaxID=161528 RepID=UPI000153F98D|nr:response regulator transcription factor [Erythrobacter sp. SD-21]EDL48774.1 two component transcriptional regulator, winged helix family protein [Erythrobacter sp. SD-21]